MATWALASTYAQSGAEAKISLGAIFTGLNLYLGNYIGEFLGEACLAAFFLLAGLSMLDEARFPRWLAWCGVVFALLFCVGAFRNAVPAVQTVRPQQRTTTLVDARPRRVAHWVIETSLATLGIG